EQLVEQGPGILVAGDDHCVGALRLAAAVRIESCKDAGSVAARIDVAGKLTALPFQLLEVALHPIDLGVQMAAFARTAEEGKAAACAPGLAAGDVEMLALAGDSRVVLL